VEEVRRMAELLEADMIVADDSLSGIQVRNLENETGLPVIDRTVLILDIFARNARTAEGKLQVELAQLEYRLPRLTGFGGALSRQGGGIGTRGPGETKLETDRRHIRSRIASLKEKLADVEKHRSYIEGNGELNRRRTKRAKDELLDVLSASIERRIKEHTEGRMDGFVESLKKRETDPYSLVSDIMGEMLK
jgi:GTP-binding protein HflX